MRVKLRVGMTDEGKAEGWLGTAATYELDGQIISHQIDLP